jgi:uncharacterized protein YkwD
MKIVLVVLLIILCSFSLASAQPKAEETAQAKSAPVPLLTKQEQALLDEINFARANPTGYIPLLEAYRTYYQGKVVRFPDGRALVTNEGVAALDDAILFLRSLKPATPFAVRKGMILSAKLHLDDMAKSGRDGHVGSDGSKPEDRLNKFGSWQDSVGEDIIYDSRTARNDVIGLIIDDGVATRGHRKNLFKTDFKVIGISLGQLRAEKTRGVITFAGDFTDKPDSKTPTPTKY